MPGPGSVIAIDRATGAQTALSTSAEPAVPTGARAFGDPTGVALESSGKLLVTERFELGGCLLRVDLKTGKQTVLASKEGMIRAGLTPLLDEPRGVALGPDGSAYVTVDGTTSRPIRRANRHPDGTGVACLVERALAAQRGSWAAASAFGNRRTHDGSLLVADTAAFGKPGGIIRIDPRTGRQSTVNSNLESTEAGGQAPFGEPNALAVGPQGKLFVTDRQNPDGIGALLVVDVRTGSVRQLSTNRISRRAGGLSAFRGPRGVAITPGGDLLVSDAGRYAQGGGAVIRVDRRTGRQTREYKNRGGRPGFFDAPSAILIEPRR